MHGEIEFHVRFVCRKYRNRYFLMLGTTLASKLHYEYLHICQSHCFTVPGAVKTQKVSNSGILYYWLDGQLGPQQRQICLDIRSGDDEH
jgi:hypothetical protein